MADNNPNPILPAANTPIAGTFDDKGNFLQAVVLNMAQPGQAPVWAGPGAPLPMVLAAPPTGLATEVNQNAEIAKQQAILNALAGVLTVVVNNLPPIQNVAINGTPPLPSGAATQATAAQILTALGTTLKVQDTSAETALQAIQTALGNNLNVVGQFYQSVQPVSATALPLPNGAATQTTLASVLAALVGGISVTDSTAEARLLTLINLLSAALPLPTGASTSALQTAGNTSLTAIAAALAASLPLPTGAATSALQTSMGTTLTSLLAAAAGTGRTIQTVPFSVTASGQLVAAVTGKRIKVFAYSLNTSLATLTVAFNSGGTAMTGAQSYLVGGGPFLAVDPPAFLFATAPGAYLGISVVGVGTVNGFVSYWADDAT